VSGRFFTAISFMHLGGADSDSPLPLPPLGTDMGLGEVKVARYGDESLTLDPVSVSSVPVMTSLSVGWCCANLSVMATGTQEKCTIQ